MDLISITVAAIFLLLCWRRSSDTREKAQGEELVLAVRE
jgi:hypothetical protein